MTLCDCADPTPGAGEHGDCCQNCEDLIGYPIIGGEVHAGYTEIGNGEAFFDAKERWFLESGADSGTVCDGYYRDFTSAEVVVPHESWKARKLGTEWVSFDHCIMPDGEVILVVLNRPLEELPDGDKFPAETGHSK